MKKARIKDLTGLFIGYGTKISIPECDYKEYIQECLSKLSNRCPADGVVCNSLSFVIGIPDDLRCEFKESDEKEKIDRAESNDYVLGADKVDVTLEKADASKEEYLISFGLDTVVYATEYNGFMMALSTLMTMTDQGGFTEQLIYDAPACSVRGYRVYLPGHETFDEFIEMLDFLVYYKYNSIILEIGGAMEYKRHPLINEKWIEFCKDMNSKPGRADEVQLSQQWAKNSIHSENGDGEYLTQDECRVIADECKRRGLEVIPECPTLSHADYICLAYPDLAERQNDPYPDTYCPSSPKVYEIVYDILDEVIDVFKPRAINIGHDEFYSVAICDKCRDKDPAQIYADDIIKIKEYLDSKGVATYMWGEKLLKARYFNGMKIGGWADPEVWSGVASTVPWMFRCADMLPCGVTYLNWYWEFGDHLDDEYHSRNFPVIYGNFNAIKCSNYRRRINYGVRGGFVSNWGSCKKEYMQRNFQYFKLVNSAYAMWSDSYDSDDADWLREYTFDVLYKTFSAGIKNPIKVLHGANHSEKPKMFWCGRAIDDSLYMLGHYEVIYTDGTKAYLPVKLGTNIASRNATEREIMEASYSTKAVKDDDKYLFEHLYENPHPDKKIESISYVPEKGKESIVIDFKFSDINGL